MPLLHLDLTIVTVYYMDCQPRRLANYSAYKTLRQD